MAEARLLRGLSKIWPVGEPTFWEVRT